jgi:hypothetical protein
MSAVKKNRYVIIDDRKIFLSIDRALSVIEIYIEDTSTSLILVKVIDNNYISILIKSFNYYFFYFFHQLLTFHFIYSTTKKYFSIENEIIQYK